MGTDITTRIYSFIKILNTFMINTSKCDKRNNIWSTGIQTKMSSCGTRETHFSTNPWPLELHIYIQAWIQIQIIQVLCTYSLKHSLVLYIVRPGVKYTSTAHVYLIREIIQPSFHPYISVSISVLWSYRFLPIPINYTVFYVCSLNGPQSARIRGSASNAQTHCEKRRQTRWLYQFKAL